MQWNLQTVDTLGTQPSFVEYVVVLLNCRLFCIECIIYRGTFECVVVLSEVYKGNVKLSFVERFVLFLGVLGFTVIKIYLT